MVKALSIILFLAFLAGLSGQEIIYENYPEGVDFWVIIPYETFKFKKNSDISEYNVSVEISNSKKKQVAGYSELLMVPRVEWLIETAIPVRFSARLGAGKYTAILQVRGAQGDKIKLKKAFTVGETHTQIGQPYYLMRKDNITFIPSRIGSPSIIPDDCRLSLKYTTDPDSILIYLADRTISVTDPYSPMDLSFPGFLEERVPESLGLSFFTAGSEIRLEPFVYSPWFSYNTRYSLKDQLSQLRYITDQNEWKSLKALPDSKIQEGIENFWSVHDPSPGTLRNENRENFYSRVIMADEKFTIHKKLRGWASDRGRIYIKFGEPDEINTEILPLGRYPSIIWIYYKQNREFYFVDLGGYGQFTLRNKDEEY
jgi:GWxTD domain-containing protein